MTAYRLGCPQCGGTDLRFWFLEPNAYEGVAYREIDAQGEATDELDDLEQIERTEGGELDDIWCCDCDASVATHLSNLRAITRDPLDIAREAL